MGAPERATLRVSLTSLLLAALVAVALLPARVHAEAPSLADASPRARKVRLHVGERQRFAAPPMGGQCCTWQLDGHTTPARALGWDFVPTSAQVGTHRVTLRIEGRAGATERWWAVRVEPPRPPAVVVASPAAPALEVAPDETVELVLRTRPSAGGETVRTSWTVNGVPAGEGETLRVAASRVGRVRARALAIGSLGSATAREWEIDVRPAVIAAAPPTTAELPPTLPPSPPTTVPAPPTPSLRAGAEITNPEVEALLQRYALAWRRHDVDELRGMGQVASEAQARALRHYFATVRDLDVEVQLLEVRSRGHHRRVRFIRRDRFRDPRGRVVTRETPIEKEVARTASGLRFVRPGP